MVIENAYALEEIKLGRRGENQARKVVFDVLGKWREGYGDGVASLIVQRNGDAQPYPVTVTEDNGALVWLVSSVDTAVAGEGAAELRYTVGDTIVKSQIYKTRVRETLEDSGETPPPGYQSWDYVVLRLLLWTGSGMRNRIFALVHLHHEDWKEEVSIYKRGIRDGKKFLKEKQR